nr:MAG TPA: hypothetical protein [Caudoviricetes sp.]
MIDTNYHPLINAFFIIKYHFNLKELFYHE